MPYKHKADYKNWYRRSGASAKRAKRQKEYRAQRRALLTFIKDVPCFDCNVKYPHYVMDFDHATGTKLFNLGKAVDDNISIENLLIEVQKCDIVCSNCHRKRTFSRKTQCE